MPPGHDALFDQARAHAVENRPDEAIELLDEIIADIGDDPDIEAAREVALALLTKATVLIDAGRTDEAVEVAAQLVRVFDAAPEEQNLTGLGFMLLDLLFLLLANDRPEAMPALCDAVVTRLRDMNPSRQAVAAGALFYKIQALSRLGRFDDVPAEATALHAIGTPALSALDRVSRQFGPEHSNPLWHAQIMLIRIGILLALGRPEEARAVTRYARGLVQKYELPAQLDETLRDIEREIGPGPA
jgi:tetratricopeptide (TPR) repeat protein